jgi:hypothetical protein
MLQVDYSVDRAREEPYCSIRHHAYSIFLEEDLERFWMAMFTAYFDDSGGSETGTVVMAGFVAPVLQWNKFKDEWNGVLDHPDYGLPAETIFHMKDFIGSRRAFSVFEGHVQDALKAKNRKSFMERLIAFTKIRATMSHSLSLRLQDYEQANESYQLKENFGSAWAFAGRACAGSVRQWAKQRGINLSEIEFVFEDGMKGKGELQDSMKRDGFLMPTFRPKSRQWPPLQAADLLAWEFHKVMKQAFANDLKHFRKSFESLMKLSGENGVFQNADELISKCIIPLGVPQRKI